MVHFGTLLQISCCLKPFYLSEVRWIFIFLSPSVGIHHIAHAINEIPARMRYWFVPGLYYNSCKSFLIDRFLSIWIRIKFAISMAQKSSADRLSSPYIYDIYMYTYSVLVHVTTVPGGLSDGRQTYIVYTCACNMTCEIHGLSVSWFLDRFQRSTNQVQHVQRYVLIYFSIIRYQMRLQHNFAFEAECINTIIVYNAALENVFTMHFVLGISSIGISFESPTTVSHSACDTTIKLASITITMVRWHDLKQSVGRGVTIGSESVYNTSDWL